MEDLSWLTYVMLILASYRLTHLIVFDKITEFIRKPFMKNKKIIDEKGRVDVKKVPKSNVGYLLNCYWCAGIWCAIIIGLGYLLIPKAGTPVIFILSIAGAQAILETFVGIGTKLIGFLSDLKK
ncbi:membrane protein [Bacillus glycinifermentans]|uniref:DUF1360 domain-containing protein n=1 Tax=Bacillus glycinifermentans TaxID=1664069 RepID=A0A0J6EGA6_9BACI|nr:DUF1360 domain-containing protein [Bacillus glycinifermentans]ATH91856.1 DUF1360 domain-containing protein [Bacillus glycinifermentans]KMM62906.1 membrane protein [Bacillus glycinifermentans]KRT87260.1 hypothetical protein AB447_208465 [Bacillus glycinifermentans]MEC0483437.1 DUF1360 domain-containing protein [Bacillus glycinifermentans]MEC0494997.1 DUF1360 domain-containing protein [Bacillus glycinifermentans]